MSKIETKVAELILKYSYFFGKGEYGHLAFKSEDALTEAIHYGIQLNNERIREGVEEMKVKGSYMKGSPASHKNETLTAVLSLLDKGANE